MHRKPALFIVIEKISISTVCRNNIKQIKNKVGRYFAVVRKISICVVYQRSINGEPKWNAKHRIVTTIISRFLRRLFACGVCVFVCF